VEQYQGAMSAKAKLETSRNLALLHAGCAQGVPENVRGDALHRLDIRAGVGVLQPDRVENVSRGLTIPRKFDERNSDVEPAKRGTSSGPRNVLVSGIGQLTLLARIPG